MRSRTHDHIRSNVVGYLALFLVITGGTAYATHPGGANTISTEDIINGQVQTPDIGGAAVTGSRLAGNSVNSSKAVNNSLTGTDVAPDTITGSEIDEASLSPACPAGYTLAGKDVCFGAQTGGNLATALAECASSGDRVPTIPEAWVVLASLPNPPPGELIITWTSNEFEDTDGSGGATPDAISMDKNSAGVISRVDTDQGAVIPYRCVTSAR